MLRVMVVDDEMWLRKGLIAALNWEEHGFIIAGEASNGREAVELIGQEPAYHLLLIDLRMPHMDGFELMRRLELRGKDVPLVIAVTGYDDFQYAQQCIKLGAFDYILKPVETEELLEAVLNAKESLLTSGKYKSDDVLHIDSPKALPEIIAEACSFILSHFDRDISLTMVAEHIDVNPNYLSSLFRQEMGNTFINYVTLLRLEKAKKLLQSTKQSISGIAHDIGYLDNKHFYKVFKKWENMTPLEYREHVQTEK
jgi:two-component system response regulator YesN